MMWFRAGDHVKHLPSGEQWILAVAYLDEVYPCGWPETRAASKDCVLLRPATDAEHVEMLERWYRINRSDARTAIARHQVWLLNAGQGDGI
jgi:hypothetical protein